MVGRTPKAKGTGLPTAEESHLAAESSRQLAKLIRSKHKNIELRISNGKKPETAVTIPEAAFELLQSSLAEMAKGNAVKLVSISPELTTQQAAVLLNVSRPYLIELIEQGAIPFRKVGSHRRLLTEDVLAFKQDIDKKRLAALDELAAQAQELGMGY